MNSRTFRFARTGNERFIALRKRGTRLKQIVQKKLFLGQVDMEKGLIVLFCECDRKPRPAIRFSA